MSPIRPDFWAEGSSLRFRTPLLRGEIPAKSLLSEPYDTFRVTVYKNVHEIQCTRYAHVCR
jgi:hypothetical protein